MSDIFSGNYSRDMWKAINSAKNIEELKDALYFVCCRLQELESRLSQHDVFPVPLATPGELVQQSVGCKNQGLCGVGSNQMCDYCRSELAKQQRASSNQT